MLEVAETTISEEKREKLYNYLAKMVSFDISVDQLSKAFNIEISTLNEIMESEQFKELLADTIQNEFDTGTTLNDAYDTIEMRAATILNTSLETSRDPNLALRAIAVVNKATRRGTNGRADTIDGARQTTVTINLSSAFVEKLAVVQNVGPRQVDAKQQNALDAKSVRKMLRGLDEQRTQDINDLEMFRVPEAEAVPAE